MLAVVLAAAALFSLDVLRAAPRDQLPTAVLLSFAAALVKFLVWGAVAAVVWRLSRRLPLDGRRWPRMVGLQLGASVVLAAVVTLLSQGLQASLHRSLLAALPPGASRVLVGSWTGGGDPGAALVMAFPWALLTTWTIFAGVAVWHWAWRARERERRAAELSGEVSRARLHALETQLHPHFLFNALHTISSLLGPDPAGARAVTRGLRGLLERLLAAEQAPVQPLAEELAFLRDYVAIQQARFGHALALELDVDPTCEQALVPCFMLQPLVENAIRHAVARRSGPTRVRVHVGCGGDDLILEVHDDGPGCDGQPGDPRAGTGIGLANTRQRLHRIYGARGHDFVFEGAAPPLGGARVRIRLPLQRRPPALPATIPAAEAAPDRPERPAERPWLAAWLLFTAAMLVLNLAWSSARYLVQARETGLSWTGTFATGAPGTIALVLLFPLVHAANRHLVARIPQLAGRLAAHALLVVALSVAKSAFVSASAAVVFGLAAAPSVLALVTTRIYADVLHYALMVGLCHALERQREHRVQALRAARLEAELAGAQLEALRLRLQPGTLFSALDRLETLIDGAPEEADRLVAGLGDHLRLLLRDPAAAEARAP